MSGIMWEATLADWGVDDDSGVVLDEALRDAGWVELWTSYSDANDTWSGITLYQCTRERAWRYGLEVTVNGKIIKWPLCGMFSEALDAIRQLEVLFRDRPVPVYVWEEPVQVDVLGGWSRAGTEAS